MSRSRKQRRSARGGSRRPASRLPEPRDLLEDVFESGGELFLPVGYTAGGVPFGPRVEIVDGELVFPDEPPVDDDSLVESKEEDSPGWDPLPPGLDSPC